MVKKTWQCSFIICPSFHTFGLFPISTPTSFIALMKSIAIDSFDSTFMRSHFTPSLSVESLSNRSLTSHCELNEVPCLILKDHQKPKQRSTPNDPSLFCFQCTILSTAMPSVWKFLSWFFLTFDLVDNVHWRRKNGKTISRFFITPNRRPEMHFPSSS